MKAILKRELKAYFTSPTGYIYLGFTLLLSGWFFASANLFAQSADMASFFSSVGIIFLFLVPMLTMRLIAEDKRNKTDQILLTSPIKVSGIVFGKYFAAVSLYGISLAIMLVYPAILFLHGKPQLGTIIALFLGFFLLGCALLSIGLFISALTESQITSAIISFAVMLFLWLSDWIVSTIGNPIVAKVLGWFSLLKRFEEFTLGVLNLSSIVYFITFSAIFIFLTIQAIEKKRWS